MLKGNCAVCKGSEVFNWEHVNEVMLHDGTRLKWLIYNCAQIEVIIGPDLQYVSIDDSLRLKCQHVDIAQKARQLKEILFLCSEVLTSDVEASYISPFTT